LKQLVQICVTLVASGGVVAGSMFSALHPAQPPKNAAASRPAVSTSTTTSAGWMAPVDAAVGDGFRPPSRRRHNGVDLLATRGTPVRAAAAGTVLVAECAPSTGDCDVDGSMAVNGCGWYVVIAHPGNVLTRYCHLGRRPYVSTGQAVGAGQIIGEVGSSGNSSAPHLHFEVHENSRQALPDNAVDPVPFMRAHNAPLGG
jgi:murein DD-endopeptidase MepM/ murein hydrolase activator NlpD